MKTVSIVKAALGGGAAILLGGLLSAAPAQAAAARVGALQSGRARSRRSPRPMPPGAAPSTWPRDAPTR